MTQIFAESLLSAFVAINAALLIFIAGVLRKVMNDMDEAAFKHFVGSLVRYSSKSPFMITILNIPAIAAIPYFYFYGFSNRWITAGLALWLLAGITSKAFKIPIYKTVAGLQSSDVARLGTQRAKLNAGNIFQAALNCAATFLMMIAFVR